MESKLAILSSRRLFSMKNISDHKIHVVDFMHIVTTCFLDAKELYEVISI